jgi:hypothetical protein
MSDQNTSLPPAEGENPFTNGKPNPVPRVVPAPVPLPADAAVRRAIRVQRWLLAVALLLVAGMVSVGCWYINRQWQDAEKRLQSTQNWTTSSGIAAVMNASNSMVRARQAESQARFSAEQARHDREEVVGMKVETATSLTNAAIELTRRLSRQITAQAQSNIMALDLSYAGRLRDLDDQVDKQRQELQKSTVENLKALSKELGKYDGLLKIDPDVAAKIETALKQMKQLVDITELLKLREEEDIKSLQNQVTILTEKLKVLELRQSNLQLSVSNALVPVPVPGRLPATNVVPAGVR